MAIVEINDELSYLEQAFNQLVDFLVNESSHADPELREEYLDDLLDSLDEIHELVTNFSIMVNNRHNKTFAETSKIIADSQFQSVFIGIIIAIILTIGTILYILLIVVPLRDILEKIRFIAKGDGGSANVLRSGLTMRSGSWPTI